MNGFLLLSFSLSFVIHNRPSDIIYPRSARDKRDLISRLDVKAPQTADRQSTMSIFPLKSTVLYSSHRAASRYECNGCFFRFFSRLLFAISREFSQWRINAAQLLISLESTRGGPSADAESVTRSEGKRQVRIWVRSVFRTFTYRKEHIIIISLLEPYLFSSIICNI